MKPEKEEVKAVTEEESESKTKARAKLNKALENAENRYEFLNLRKPVTSILFLFQATKKMKKKVLLKKSHQFRSKLSRKRRKTNLQKPSNNHPKPHTS